MKKTNRIMRACVALALAGGATGASAAGFQLMEQNASGLGNAYAGQAAAAENASTIFFNPAGMSLLPGAQVTGSVNFIRPSVKFTDSGASRAPLGLAGTPEPAGGLNGGDAGGWNTVPDAYLSYQITPSIWAGVGISAPFGLKTQYDANFIGRFQSQSTVLKTYDVNPSVAWKINDTISVGAGLSYQHANFKLDRSFSKVVTEVPQSLDLSDNGLGWNLGAMFSPGAKTRIGLAYRSSVGYQLSGGVNVAATAGFPTTATANVRLPATTSLALSQALNDKWQLLADATFTQWSSVKAVPLVLASGVVGDTFNFQFRDSWRAGIGANYKWTPDLMLKLGVAYDQTPVTDQFRTTTLPDNDRTWLSIGGKWAASKQSTVDFGYAHLFVSNSSINQVRGVVPIGAQQGNVVGSYKNSVDIVSMQYTYSF
jgi:long-chain fatty acid transport protein